MEKTIRGLLQTIQGLCELRNSYGMASQGRDGFSARLDLRQATLAAQAADTIVSFLYRIHCDALTQTPGDGEFEVDGNSRVYRLITEDIPDRATADAAYRNAKQNSDWQKARVEHDMALLRMMTAVLKDDTELFKQFMDNKSFRCWVADAVFGLTYEQPAEG